MDVWATDEGFFIGAMFSSVKYKYNKDDSISVWTAGDEASIDISTNRGTFVEALDGAGNVFATGGDGKWFYVSISKKPVVLRRKALPKIKLSKAELNKARNKVKRCLLSDAPYTLDVPDKLLGVIEWMKEKLKSIPAKCRESAEIDFNDTMSRGESYPNIEITYWEAETDAEIIERLQIDAERARIAEEKERDQYKRLRDRFKDE